MGRNKATHCDRGHPLEEPNVIYNPDGCRECRKCKYARSNAYRKAKRAKIKELNERIVSTP